jgi:(p)ppGpp synthase/HD superfamily hydrolase
MSPLDSALLVAEQAHSNQMYDIYPYMYHIRKAVEIGQELGYDEAIIVGLALHDVIEDGGLSFNDIKKGFGQEVAEIVYAVTDELGRNRKERKEKTYPKIRANWKATVVKVCDRIANVSHSKEFTPLSFKMYQKEHENFCNELMFSDHPKNEVGKAWRMLNDLIDN